LGSNLFSFSLSVSDLPLFPFRRLIYLSSFDPATQPPHLSSVFSVRGSWETKSLISFEISDPPSLLAVWPQQYSRSRTGCLPASSPRPRFCGFRIDQDKLLDVFFYRVLLFASLRWFPKPLLLVAIVLHPIFLFFFLSRVLFFLFEFYPACPPCLICFKTRLLLPLSSRSPRLRFLRLVFILELSNFRPWLPSFCLVFLFWRFATSSPLLTLAPLFLPFRLYS